jgi:hypothetical protein
MSKELLKDPINYAKGAIDALQAQLETSISKYKKIKLNSKITQWKKFVELMEGEENVSKAEESI